MDSRPVGGHRELEFFDAQHGAPARLVRERLCCVADEVRQTTRSPGEHLAPVSHGAERGPLLVLSESRR